MDSHTATQPMPPRPRTFLFDQYSSKFVRRRLLPCLRPRYRCAIASGFPVVLMRAGSRINTHALCIPLQLHCLCSVDSLLCPRIFTSSRHRLWIRPILHSHKYDVTHAHVLCLLLLCCSQLFQYLIHRSSMRSLLFLSSHITLSVPFHPVVHSRWTCARFRAPGHTTTFAASVNIACRPYLFRRSLSDCSLTLVCVVLLTSGIGCALVMAGGYCYHACACRSCPLHTLYIFTVDSFFFSFP